ncbi:MAG: hypothetical protein ACAI44_06660 [Candidatus Sericytochromatia bacterium]
MLDDQQILRDIHALPPEKQSEVLDFIAFVKARKTAVEEASVPAYNTFSIRPASHPSGHQNTSRDHDAILGQAAAEKHKQ